MLLQLILAIAAGNHDRHKLPVQKIIKNFGFGFWQPNIGLLPVHCRLFTAAQVGN